MWHSDGCICKKKKNSEINQIFDQTIMAKFTCIMFTEYLKIIFIKEDLEY